MVVEVRPDPFQRRQVARWLLGAFEVLVPTALVSAVSGWFGVNLGMAVADALGKGLAGAVISAVVWGPVFSLAGAYATLRFLAR
jgi:hypothetical protein